MTVYLLDVNILIPLVHPTHEFALAAKTWFDRVCDEGWSTCPQTESGLIRILSNPNYPTPSNDPVYYAGLLRELVRLGNHHFWPDDITLRNVLTTNIQVRSSEIADLYLLALAIEHGGAFATFDQGVRASLIPGGTDALELISP